MFVRANVSLPEFDESRWLRPDAEYLMVIIREHDAPAATHGANHLCDGLFGRSQVFEDEAGVGHVKGSPFGRFEGELKRIAVPPLYQIRFAGVLRLSLRLVELLLVPLEANHPTTRCDGAGDIARELPQAAAHIQHRFPGAQRQFPQASSIEQLVQKRESPLLLWFGTVKVTMTRPG